MPKCNKCSKSQSKLNKGGLCKECLNKKINGFNGDTNESIIVYETVDQTKEDDKYFIDIMKDHMMREKELSNDMIEHLKEEVRFLKDELLHKNDLIYKFLPNLSSCNNKPDLNEYYCDNLNVENRNTIPRASSTSIKTPLNERHLNKIHNDISTNNNMHSANKILDCEPVGNTGDDVFQSEQNSWNVDDNVDASSIAKQQLFKKSSYSKQHETLRPNVVINKYPENDLLIYHAPKHVPGNATYANMTSKGTKTAIITDSICSKIKMKQFNTHLQNGYAYRKAFPGGTSEEIAYYATNTVTKDLPDSVIINVGSNDLSNLDSDIITDNIMGIVNMCHEHGVSDIFVSSIAYRKGQEEKIYKLNANLRFNQEAFRFMYIDNSNITQDDIWKDNIHLNNQGLTKIANNFICALNRNTHS